ncbi:hypothetical protein Vretimale_9015 [Volvox reticuliferus]|uniref:ABC transporter domain-containing protein n=1 Tax=Volvox reticuliferus TaxID=1737510 RepID=A0A8J4GBW9_9CHLO|nr:hypothetical protein Vretifemale_14474 [Volvox reticuliferus]GIM04433.1 hypothetical protein Vretimale_9015 [Volvox reticuliferus]
MAHLEHIRGAFIEWQDVNFSVPDRSTGHQKRILTDMHGLAQPGRLLAIMGPSGAGKSTLLDILAGNSSSRGATCKGLILVDGSPRNVRAFRVISCYVQQKDVLMSSATVREVLLTSALLKLPRSVPLSRKRALVEDTIRELDLASCADTLIGDETIGLKGVSGGQKRRVSVGVELVKDPRILFLDEPSSGLDSEMALSVVTTLVRLARKGRTVVCTIHQPNSDITECFDDFLLLSSGRTVYGGLWSGAVDFFARNGFSCPAFKNPTDYFMSVVTREEGAVETLATAYGKVRLDLLQQMAAVGRRSRLEVGGGSGGDSGGDDVAINLRGMGTEDVCVLHDAAAAVVAGGGDGGGDGSVGVSAVVIPSVLGQDSSREVLQQRQRQGAAAPLEAVPERRVLVLDGEVGEAPAAEEPAQMAGVPLWFQVYVLSVRYWRTWIRNPVMMASELVQYIFTAIFIGLMYCRFNNVFGEGDYNRISCIWFSFAILCFTPSYTAVTNWASERLLLKRELGQRLYGITAYYLARYSVLVPFQMAQCLLFLAVMYFFAGFQASVTGFFTFFAVFSMFQIISEGVGACCAVATRTPTSSVILLTFVLLVLLAFSGFLTTTVPVYFRWIHKVSYLTYAFSALVEREFSHVTFYDDTTGEAIPGVEAYPASLRTGLSYSQNVGILAGQVGGMEVVKFLAFNLAYRMNLI